jgi:hypothetical protein
MNNLRRFSRFGRGYLCAKDCTLFGEVLSQARSASKSETRESFKGGCSFLAMGDECQLNSTKVVGRIREADREHGQHVKSDDLWKTLVTGDPGGSRTPNPQIRSLMLYPVELRGRYKIATT